GSVQLLTEDPALGPRPNRPRRAAVSAFGISGTQCPSHPGAGPHVREPRTGPGHRAAADHGPLDPVRQERAGPPGPGPAVAHPSWAEPRAAPGPSRPRARHHAVPLPAPGRGGGG
ncbi:LOW QUALITY PROTEIN: polyketide synthase, partial [Streptomyces himastatinicus ATCC 53653]